MGRVKEMYDEYIMSDPEMYRGAELKDEIESVISGGIYEDVTQLKEFLETVTPEGNYDYFIYIADTDGTYVNLRYDREEYIYNLCCLSQHPITLFYHIAAFKEWIKNENVQVVKCLYVDIDDVGINADDASEELAYKIFREDYQLPDELLPNYVVFSGHGMHICYLVDKMVPQEEEIRMKYTQSLITHFLGDFSGAPASHMFRCPCSWNVKDIPVKGKIFKLNSSRNRDIHRLDCFLKTEEEIERYKQPYYRRIREKQKATVAKRKAEEKEFLEALGDMTLEEFLQSPGSISNHDRELAKKLWKRKWKKEERKRKNGASDEAEDEDDLLIEYERALPYKNLEFYNNYDKNNRTWNILLDLHNFFIRHKGCLVSRNMFFMIIASLFKNKHFSCDYAIRYCYRYTDEEYYKEMCQTIERTYSSKNTYRFRLTTIAALLCFDETDIERSYCNFSTERKKQAKSRRNKEFYEKQKAKNGKTDFQKKKDYQREYIRNHPDITAKELMEALSVSRATAFRLLNENKY